MSEREGAMVGRPDTRNDEREELVHISSYYLQTRKGIELQWGKGKGIQAATTPAPQTPPRRDPSIVSDEGGGPSPGIYGLEPVSKLGGLSSARRINLAILELGFPGIM
ncbi:uncharacterized protein LOC116203185 [Punica granatum]|uniref:Uncharacterized protein LOC116203185 n=1 Tax=Punica granatum TaxID=22663 RepID=A0A6P8D879_PUNGR|nr:uncharacterized protein LOC116203185 [Punica granatum]